jgi:hypothetical protein
MFDIRNFSNKAIVVFLFLGLVLVEGVGALAQPAHQLAPAAERATDGLIIDPNMVFYLLPHDVIVKVGDTFVVTVVVVNAENMFGWQVFLRFDPAILQVVGVSFPSNHVFSSSVTVSGALANYDSTQFQQGPLQDFNTTVRLLAGDCLLGANQPTFNGSGVLCQIEFKAISSGASVLVLPHDSASEFQTFNLTPDIEAVTASSDSYMNVYAVWGPH